MLDPVTLDQLRILVTVVDTGSFSAAARNLSRAQSGISHAIQSLEAALGVVLFDRDEKRPKLTEIGYSVLRDAQAVLRQMETLKADTENFSGQFESHIALAVEAPFPNAVLAESLAALKENFPNLPVSLSIESIGQSERRLRSGAANLGIYSISATSAVGLSTEEFISLPVVPVVAAEHPLAKLSEPISADVLENYVELSHAAMEGVASRQTWLFADNGRRMEFLLAGHGWANVSAHSAAPYFASGRLKTLSLKEPSGYDIAMHVVYRRGRPPGKAARWLLGDLRTRLNALIPAEVYQPRRPEAAYLSGRA